MEPRVIETKEAPEAIGPYVQAIHASPFIFTSGQIALNTDGEMVGDAVEPQARQVLNNLAAILEEAGCSAKDIVKTTIFLTNIDDFAIVNLVYSQFFGDHKPARSTVQVAKLPKNALVEIEAIALAPNA